MKYIVVISDIQFGHKLAVAPDEFQVSQLPPASPTWEKPNSVGSALLRAWKVVVKEWAEPDILVINGEPIEGQQPRNKGIEVYTSNLDDQLEGAKTLIEMFNAKRIYSTRGTDYHVMLNGIPLEETFGKMVGAQKVGGYHAPYELYLEEEGVRFNFAHHVGGSQVWQYRGTPITREMLLAKVNESHKWPSTVIIRSHVHYYWFVGSTSHLGMITPCWQLQTWYAYRRTASGMVPDIGAVRFKVEDGGFDWEAKLFKLPEFRPPLIKNGREIKAKKIRNDV